MIPLPTTVCVHIHKCVEFKKYIIGNIGSFTVCFLQQLCWHADSIGKVLLVCVCSRVPHHTANDSCQHALPVIILIYTTLDLHTVSTRLAHMKLRLKPSLAGLWVPLVEFLYCHTQVTSTDLSVSTCHRLQDSIMNKCILFL